MSSMVPITRTLPYVLREALDQSGKTTVMIGRVTAVPDNAHVTVDLQGSTITVPKLKSYSAPVVGEPVYVLSDPLYTVALGSVSPTPPPPITDAGTLDGIDSLGFLIRQTAANERVWWTRTSGTTVGGQITVNHPLGRVPSLVIAMSTVYGTAIVQKAEAFATNVVIYTTGGTSFDAWVLVIG